MAARLPLRCEVRLGKQTSFDEPLIRTNDQPAGGPAIHPSIAAWDEKRHGTSSQHIIRNRKYLN
ncbi:hypothetical protein ACQ86N_40320 [Puia sp. P3]|uniref:hypothetical protein n=1 Tax=Puia sp. P3 TaxID=3423952 RepID=UPI003D674B8C